MTYSIYVQGDSFQTAKIYNEEDTTRIILDNRYLPTMMEHISFSRKDARHYIYLIGRFSSIEEAKWFIAKEVMQEFNREDMNDNSRKGIHDKAWRYYEKHKDKYLEYLL